MTAPPNTSAEAPRTGVSLLDRLGAELVVTDRKSEATLILGLRRGGLASHELTHAKNEVGGNEISGSVHPEPRHLPANERALERRLHGLLEASPSLLLIFNGQPLARLADGA